MPVILSAALFSLVYSPIATLAADAVYVVTNKADENSIIGFTHDGEGGFIDLGEFPTGGRGTGDLEVPGLSPRDDSHPLLDGQDPLISAYAIQKTQDGRFVLVVNPGDGTISSMKVNDDKTLTAVSTVKSGGAFPISIANHGDSVFVVNIGKSNFKGRLTSFKIGGDGTLTAVEDSVRKLGRYGGRPSAVGVTPNGKHVVVTQVLSGVIGVYAQEDGKLSKKPVSTINSPQVDKTRFLANPVGFDFISKPNGDSILVVTEARNFAPGLQLTKRDGQFFFETSSMSSYRITADGGISMITGDALTGTAREGGQRANCWIGLSADGKYAYGVNALDSSITSYSVADDGSLSMLNETAFKSPDYAFLTDIYRSSDGRFFYQLHGFGGQVTTLKVEDDGGLTKVGVWDGDVPEVGAFGVLAL